MIRCRAIESADLAAIAGFEIRSPDYWMKGLRRTSVRDVPEGLPRFGYMLDHDGTAVGVLLLIYAARDGSGETFIRCNVSSWYVEPTFRNYAPMLTKVAQRHKHVTYVDISPAYWTWPIAFGEGHARPSLQQDAQAIDGLSKSRCRAACTARGRRLPRPGVVSRRLNITILISNNRSYGTIRTHQERAFPKRPWGTVLSNPDFAALDRAFGAQGYTITNAAQAAEVVAEAMSANGPVLIEVRSDVCQTIDRSLAAVSAGVPVFR